MRKLLTTTILLLVVVLAAPMWAQTTSDVYQLHPFFDGNLDRVLIVNSGQTGTPISSDEGVLCADIYVFDANQEMSECCGCAVTADGTLNLNSADLRDNPLTGITPTNGTIKIVSSALTGKKCDPTNPVPTPDLRAYMWANGYSRFAEAPLQAGEQGFLGQACAFVLYLGSSKGQCRCSID